MLVLSTSVDETLSGTFVIDVASPMSECGGPLAQEHLYNYRSGWRQLTSGKPRTPHAQPSHTVDEDGAALFERPANLGELSKRE
jgi:hypothetical protein